MEIGNCHFRLEPPGSANTFLPLKEALLHPAVSGQTLEETIRLPDAPHDRHLVTLYHFCFWVAEGIEEQAFMHRALRLLLESFRAQEAHLYSSSRELQCWLTEEKKKPQVKLADFLGRQFQSNSEAVILSGSSIGQHQKGIAAFNFLVGPIGSGGSSIESPFVVLVRSASWRDFAADDRVLLHAICQLWARGLAKATQIRELREENDVLRKRAAGSASFLGTSPQIEKLRREAQRPAANHANRQKIRRKSVSMKSGLTKHCPSSPNCSV